MLRLSDLLLGFRTPATFSKRVGVRHLLTECFSIVLLDHPGLNTLVCSVTNRGRLVESDVRTCVPRFT
jgi:hypothetical protein